MAVAVEISRSCQAPAGRQSRAHGGANHHVIVKIQYRRLMRARPLNDQVRTRVTVKVGYHSPGCWRSKSPIGAVGRPSSIAAYDSEMISRARNQAAEVRNDIVRRVAGVILNCRAGDVINRGSVLEMNSSNQSVWL